MLICLSGRIQESFLSSHFFKTCLSLSPPKLNFQYYSNLPLRFFFFSFFCCRSARLKSLRAKLFLIFLVELKVFFRKAPERSRQCTKSVCVCVCAIPFGAHRSIPAWPEGERENLCWCPFWISQQICTSTLNIVKLTVSIELCKLFPKLFSKVDCMCWIQSPL